MRKNSRKIAFGFITIIVIFLMILVFFEKGEQTGKIIIEEKNKKKVALDVEVVPVKSILSQKNQYENNEERQDDKKNFRVVPERVFENRMLVNRDKWKNVGFGSPEDTIQTIYKGIADIDIDTISKAIYLSDVTRKNAEKLLIELVPSKVLEEYKETEKILALMLADDENVKGYLISTEMPQKEGRRRYTVMTPGVKGQLELSIQEFIQDNNGNWLRVIQPNQISRWVEQQKKELRREYNRKR